MRLHHSYDHLSIMSLSLRILSAFAVVLAGVWPTSPVQAQDDQIALLEEAFPGVTFELPLGIRFPNDGRHEVYIAEHGGRVKVLDRFTPGAEPTVFLDLSERIATSPPGEFFAIEFHPNYAENGTFFVRYKLQDPERTVLSRFERSADNPLEADPESEVILFAIETPGNANNHHGGDIAFGPDGYLYVPLGDGGVTFDAVGNAQDRTKLLGKVLRLDVDNPSGGLNYGIPPDNPYVGNTEGWREEVWAYGFRNPWRLTVDRETGEVWVGDVGEAHWEEVDRVEAGGNYGWPIMEGPVCAPFGPPECDQGGLTLPVWAYPRDVGTSITGGYVYRGSKIPVLRGQYVFADFGSYTTWTVETDNPEHATLLLEPLYPGFAITTFGQDLEGELYLTEFFSGQIFKLEPGPGATDAEGGPALPETAALRVYPNPIRDAATVEFSGADARVRLALYDLLGREVAVLYDGYGSATAQRMGFSTRGLAPGVYVLRMESGAGVQAQKVSVVR